jgi:hypothetical protein
LPEKLKKILAKSLVKSLALRGCGGLAIDEKSKICGLMDRLMCEAVKEHSLDDGDLDFKTIMKKIDYRDDEFVAQPKGVRDGIRDSLYNTAKYVEKKSKNLKNCEKSMNFEMSKNGIVRGNEDSKSEVDELENLISDISRSNKKSSEKFENPENLKFSPTFKK